MTENLRNAVIAVMANNVCSDITCEECQKLFGTEECPGRLCRRTERAPTILRELRAMKDRNHIKITDIEADQLIDELFGG